MPRKSMFPSALPFKEGDRVLLARVVHAEFKGKVGFADRYIKKDDTVVVVLPETGMTYRADAKNIDAAGGPLDPMIGYAVNGYKEAGGEETTRFECVISCPNGRTIIASNGGTGGCNEYRGDSDAEDAFFEATKKWAPYYGSADMFEPEDFWLDWYVGERTKGVSAAMVVAQYEAEFRPIRENAAEAKKIRDQQEAERLAALGPLHIPDGAKVDPSSRFSTIEIQGRTNGCIVKDLQTGRSVDVPLYALSHVERTLAALFPDETE